MSLVYLALPETTEWNRFIERVARENCPAHLELRTASLDHRAQAIGMPYASGRSGGEHAKDALVNAEERNLQEPPVGDPDFSQHNSRAAIRSVS